MEGGFEDLEREWRLLGGADEGADEQKRKEGKHSNMVVPIVVTLVVVGIVTAVVYFAIKHMAKGSEPSDVVAPSTSQLVNGQPGPAPAPTPAPAPAPTRAPAAASGQAAHDNEPKTMDELVYASVLEDRKRAAEDRTIVGPGGRVMKDTELHDDDDRVDPVDSVRNSFVGQFMDLGTPAYVSDIAQRTWGVPTEEDVDAYTQAIREIHNTPGNIANARVQSELEYFNM